VLVAHYILALLIHTDVPSPYCKVYGSIYEVSEPKLADFIVYEELSESFADIIVYEQPNRLYANKPGMWFFEKNKDFAKFRVYFTQYKDEAQFSAFFTKFESYAGCNP
jgi:hypothetical protein